MPKRTTHTQSPSLHCCFKTEIRTFANFVLEGRAYELGEALLGDLPSSNTMGFFMFPFHTTKIKGMGTAAGRSTPSCIHGIPESTLRNVCLTMRICFTELFRLSSGLNNFAFTPSKMENRDGGGRGWQAAKAGMRCLSQNINSRDHGMGKIRNGCWVSLIPFCCLSFPTGVH